MTQVVDVTVIYAEPQDSGWTVNAGGEKQHFVTASGAIFHGIQSGRELAKTGREVWVLWRNGEAWSVAWTSEKAPLS